jgi:hypothetical protein
MNVEINLTHSMNGRNLKNWSESYEDRIFLYQHPREMFSSLDLVFQNKDIPSKNFKLTSVCATAENVETCSVVRL